MAGQKKKLHITIDNNGQTSKRSFEVAAVILGRSPECFIQLNHTDISRKHLNIYVKENEVWVEDMGSSNGTFLNAAQLKPLVPYKVKPTDQITLGKSTGISIFAHIDSATAGVAGDPVSTESSGPKPVIPQSLHIPEAHLPDMAKVGTPDGRQKVLRTAQEEAAEIIRIARKEAELEVQSIFERAQKTQKEAEDFYRKRLQEASTDAEELRSDTRRECESLLAKTRQTCDEIRKQVDVSITELRSKTREECDQMYQEMEAQIKQVKDHRIREMEEGVAHKETEILEDARNRMAIAEKDLQETLASTLKIHNEKLKTELEHHKNHILEAEELQKKQLEQEKTAHKNQIDQELKLHTEKIESELLAHNNRIQSELQSHDEKIATEWKAHTERIRLESEDLENRVAREVAKHQEDLKHEVEEVRLKIASDLENHEKDMLEKREFMSQEIDHFTDKKSQLEKQIATSKEEILGLKKEIESLTDKEQSYQAAILELEKTNQNFQRHNSSLESEISEMDKKLKGLKKEYEVLHNSYQSLGDKKNQALADYEADVIKLKSKLESEKERHVKEEKEHLLYLKQETTKKVQQAERELLVEISRKKSSFVREILLSLEKTSQIVGQNLPEWRSEIKNLEKAILDQVEGHLFSMQIEGSVVAEKATISKHKRKERFTHMAYGCVMGVLLVFGITFGIQKLEGPSPLDRAVASEVEARKRDLELRKFDPPKSAEFKDNYVDAVIYTDGYYDLTTSEEYQTKWSLALAKHMLKLWKVDEDSSLQVASIANALVKSLQERKESIHPDYIQDGLNKMKELEAESVKRMTAILGSQVRFESLKKFEKDYFIKYRNQVGQ